jgi:hypothetical protein|tara:strand:- start:24 stop:221 length:198 start_codon:yes stop_codon:yes gene_type:complete
MSRSQTQKSRDQSKKHGTNPVGWDEIYDSYSEIRQRQIDEGKERMHTGNTLNERLKKLEKKHAKN